MDTGDEKPQRGVMIDVFIEDSVEKQIKEIQKSENLRNERDVIYRAIQFYFDNITKDDIFQNSMKMKVSSKTSFDGTFDMQHLRRVMGNVEGGNMIQQLPQSDVYGLDGAGIIWIFHNRVLPVKFTLMCLSKMIVEQNDPWVDLDDLKKYTQDSAEHFADMLSNFHDVEILRGARTGFPKTMSSIRNTGETLDDDKILLSQSRSKKRFSEQFVGRKLRIKRTQNSADGSSPVAGACFEMGLIHAKSAYADSENHVSKNTANPKKKISVTLTEQGMEFASLKNNLIEFVYGRSETVPEKIFLESEKNFFLNEILPRFEFENNFVKYLLDGGTVESSNQLKGDFEKMYTEFLRTKFPDEVTGDLKWSPDTFRIRSLVTMARLIELGIFKKQPGTKSGPYILC